MLTMSLQRQCKHTTSAAPRCCARLTPRHTGGTIAVRSTQFGAGEGAPLSWRPSADAVAGKRLVLLCDPVESTGYILPPSCTHVQYARGEGMTEIRTPSMLDVFNDHFDRAAVYVKAPADLLEYIRACHSVYSIKFPVRIRGKIQIFNAYRAEHSHHR